MSAAALETKGNRRHSRRRLLQIGVLASCGLTLPQLLDHTRAFLDRHHNELLYGSDCADAAGTGTACQGAQTIAAIRKFVPNKAAERKILYENSKQLFRLNRA